MCMRTEDWKGGVRSPGTGVLSGCELPSVGLATKLGPLQKQQVLLKAEHTLKGL